MTEQQVVDLCNDLYARHVASTRAYNPAKPDRPFHVGMDGNTERYNHVYGRRKGGKRADRIPFLTYIGSELEGLE